MVSETGAPLAGCRDTVDGERADVDTDQEKNQGKRDQQHLQRDLVGGLAALGPFDQRDHPIKKGLARVCGDPDDDGIGNDCGAAGDRAAISPRFADHRGRFAGHRRLVDQGSAGHHFAITGDQLTRLHQDVVIFTEFAGANRALRARKIKTSEPLGNDIGAGLAQTRGPGLAAPLGQGLGKGGKKNRQPKPDGHRAGEPDRFAVGTGEREDEGHQGDAAGNLNCQHDRVTPEATRIEFFESLK